MAVIILLGIVYFMYFQPRKALLDQLGLVLGGSDDKLPDSLLLVNTAEWQGQVCQISCHTLSISFCSDSMFNIFTESNNV